MKICWNQQFFTFFKVWLLRPVFWESVPLCSTWNCSKSPISFILHFHNDHTKVWQKNITFGSPLPWLWNKRAPFFGPKSPFWTPNLLPLTNNELTFAQIQPRWPKIIFGHRAGLIWITLWLNSIFQLHSNGCYRPLYILVYERFSTHLFWMPYQIVCHWEL